MELAARARLARAISTVENRGRGWREAVASAYRSRPRAPIIGITGAPGAGKSCLVDGLAAHWAAAGAEVAVIAVDPASPFSGGALLGDRVRMSRSEGLDRVYIRSVSGRAHPGALSDATADICMVAASCGIDRILVETVGAGQSEIEVRNLADCVAVVAVPGLGDALQAAKAGIMEIGDLYVVNKSDQPGAGTVRRDIMDGLRGVYAGEPGRNAAEAEMTASMPPSPGRRALVARHGGPGEPTWHPPVLAASALSGEGIPAIAAAIDAFLAFAAETGRDARLRAVRARRQILRAVERLVLAEVARRHALGGEDALDRLVGRMLDDGIDPYGAAEQWFGTTTADGIERRPTS